MSDHLPNSPAGGCAPAADETTAHVVNRTSPTESPSLSGVAIPPLIRRRLWRLSIRSLRAVGLFLWRPLPAPENDRSGRRGSNFEYAELLSLVFFVCLTILGAKTYIACRYLNSPHRPPQVVGDETWPSVLQILYCSADDFAVGVGCLLGVALILRVLRSAWGRRFLRFGVHALATLAVAFTLINVELFAWCRTFLTYDLFEKGGGFVPERSILDCVTPEVRALLAFLPLLILTVHLLGTHYLPAVWLRLPRVICRPCVLVLLLGGLCYASDTAHQQDLFDDASSNYPQNPHLLMVRSLFTSSGCYGDLGDAPPAFAEFEPNQPRHAGLALRHRPKNIIVVVIECAATQYLQVHGHPEKTTPRLMELYEKGCLVRADNFYSTANQTIAAALPIFSATWNATGEMSTVVKYPTFPVANASPWLRQHGYETGFLASGGTWTWEGFRNLADAYVARGWDIGRDANHPFWAAAPLSFKSDDYMDREMFADARRYIETVGEQKFFLMLWNYDTHARFYVESGPDWDPDLFPGGVRGLEDAEACYRRYLNGLHQTDRLLGELHDSLEKKGLLDDTLIVVTGDHGEAWGQHGFLSHGHKLFEEEVHVPLLLIHRPLAEKVGRNLATIGSHVDLWATLTDICGIPFNPLWQGSSLLASNASDRRAYFSRRGLQGVREGKYKYLWDLKNQREMLFDLEADPGEQSNIARSHPDYSLRQRRRLRDWSLFQDQLTQKRLAEAEGK